MADNFQIRIGADNTEQAKQEMQDRIRKALEAMGLQAESLAKQELQNSPSRIDTGLLRNSITHALDGEATATKNYSASNASKYNGKTPSPGSYSGTMPKEDRGAAVYIGSNITYGSYVHEGTDRMAPNRFLKNAIENNIQQLRDIEIQMLSDG